MRLFSELKRRNVLRMVVLYVVAAWLVMQVAEVVIALGNLPDWVGPLILVLLASGFPIAVMLSWFYELTPDGISLEKDVEAGESILHITGRRMDFVVISLLCAAVILFAVDKWWALAPPQQSIAVLPFENMSGDPEQEYFSDGISEEVLNLLAQMPELRVISRSSAFSFKGKDVAIPTLAKELNVAHVLEGSVRKMGSRVRITVQLIEVSSDSHLWSESYDRELTATNLFQIQSDIASSIAGQMRTALNTEEQRQLAAVPTENMDAYAAYLLGRQRLTDRKVVRLGEAAEQFAYAIELDPQYAAAYAGLHDACQLFEIYGGGDMHAQCPDSVENLEPLLRKALVLDDTLGEAWISLGFWQIERGDDRSAEAFAAAEAAITHGLELSPSFSLGYLWYSNMLFKKWYSMALEDIVGPQKLARHLARWEKVKAVARRGLEIDPLSVPLHYVVAQQNERDGDLNAAMWHAQRMVEIAPDSPRGYERLAELNWSMLGRIDEAIRLASQAADLDPDHSWYPLLIGYAYTSLGEYDRALEYLAIAQQLTTGRRSEGVTEAEALTLISAGRQYEAELVLREYLAPPERKLSLGVGMALWLLSGMDLAAGRPDVALARYQRFTPSCFEDETPRYCAAYRLQIARVIQELGDLEQADQWVQKEWDVYQAVDVGWQRPRTNIFKIGIWDAMRLALLGRNDEALDVLEAAVTAGWRGYSAGGPIPWTFHAHFNMTLDSIRDESRFQAAFATIEADMAVQLESVRQMERDGLVRSPQEWVTQ